jgi:two-component sensor histidine kinase
MPLEELITNSLTYAADASKAKRTKEKTVVLIMKDVDCRKWSMEQKPTQGEVDSSKGALL